MTAKSKLEALLHFFLHVRNVGHTTAMVEGARNFDGELIVIAADERNAERLRKLLPGRTVVNIQQRHRLVGTRCAAVLDNHTVLDVVSEGFHCIKNLEDSIAEYRRADAQQQDTIANLKAENEKLRRRYHEHLEGTSHLTKALAEAVGLTITAAPNMHGLIWEQFHDGVIRLKQEKDAWRTIAADLASDYTATLQDYATTKNPNPENDVPAIQRWYAAEQEEGRKLNVPAFTAKMREEDANQRAKAWKTVATTLAEAADTIRKDSALDYHGDRTDCPTCVAMKAIDTALADYTKVANEESTFPGTEEPEQPLPLIEGLVLRLAREMDIKRFDAVATPEQRRIVDSELQSRVLRFLRAHSSHVVAFTEAMWPNYDAPPPITVVDYKPTTAQIRIPMHWRINDKYAGPLANAHAAIEQLSQLGFNTTETIDHEAQQHVWTFTSP